MENYPLARELVLVGGGHSHVICLRMLAMKPVPGLKVTLISPDIRTPYSGMLPGLVAGHYSTADVHIDLVPLCRFAGADFIQGSVVGLDLDRQQVQIAGRPSQSYDVLSLDIGSTPSQQQLAQTQAVLPVKPISRFLTRWQAFLTRYQAGEIRRVGFVGAGAGGVELCLAVHHRLSSQAEAPLPEVHLFTSGKTVLTDYAAGVRIRFEALLAARNIHVHREFKAQSYDADGNLCSDDGRQVALDEAFWVTQAGAQPWLAESGLAVDEGGFVQVEDTLQSTSHSNVFAVGDCAAMVHHPRPKAGVYAVRQGPPLFRNLAAYALGDAVSAYKPQSTFLSLISTGDQHAIASRNGFSTAGHWVWRWKDWIDQRFMARFSDLPVMHRKPLNTLQAEFDDQMHCGGCGSKVASDLLSEVLQALMPGAVPEGDAALINVPPGKVLLQSVDHFRSFLNDPYQQARIAVSHALSDVYACGGEALSVQASITLPFGKPSVSRSLLTAILSGTRDQLAEEGAQLVGGHTSEGPELSIGFTANGLVDEQALWRKQPGLAGLELVLTKPLGTGVLFAADMQHRARGEWINAAVAMMSISNRESARICREVGINACTDITGFGLAGHALEMTGPGIGIALDITDIPLLAGVRECFEELGIRSSLHEANRRASGLTGSGYRNEILFDPQTAGGLLIAVEADLTDELLRRLREAGYPDAAKIGKTIASPGITIA